METVIKKGRTLQPAIPPACQPHDSSECSHKIYKETLLLHTSHTRITVQGKNPNLVWQSVSPSAPQSGHVSSSLCLAPGCPATIWHPTPRQGSSWAGNH